MSTTSSPVTRASTNIDYQKKSCVLHASARRMGVYVSRDDSDTDSTTYDKLSWSVYVICGCHGGVCNSTVRSSTHVTAFGRMSNNICTRGARPRKKVHIRPLTYMTMHLLPTSPASSPLPLFLSNRDGGVVRERARVQAVLLSQASAQRVPPSTGLHTEPPELMTIDSSVFRRNRSVCTKEQFCFGLH